MLKRFYSCVIVSLLLTSGSAFAEEVIGIVDWRLALFQSDAAKVVDAAMKSDNEKVLGRVRVLEGKLETARKKLSKDRDLLSADELLTLEKEFQRDLSEFNLLRGKLQEIQAATENRFILEQRPRIDKALEKIAKKHGLTLVLDRQSVVYGLQARELTPELIDALNNAE